jgi:hypothetical protein
VRHDLNLSKLTKPKLDLFNPVKPGDVLVTREFIYLEKEKLPPGLVEQMYKWAAGGDDSIGRYGLAHLANMEGQSDKALAQHTLAVKLLEHDYRALPDIEARAALFGTKVDFYHWPMLHLLQQGKLPEAFDLSEASRARALFEPTGLIRQQSDKDVLGGGGRRGPARPDEGGPIAGHEGEQRGRQPSADHRLGEPVVPPGGEGDPRERGPLGQDVARVGAARRNRCRGAGIQSGAAGREDLAAEFVGQFVPLAHRLAVDPDVRGEAQPSQGPHPVHRLGVSGVEHFLNTVGERPTGRVSLRPRPRPLSRIRTNENRPLSFSPCSTKLSLPASSPSAKVREGSAVS